MLDIIRTQNRSKNFNRITQHGCEVKKFMKNFFDAVAESSQEEIETYYADEMTPLNFPMHVRCSNETIIADDHIATYSCSIRQTENTDELFVCVLDKSEGYWQIISGQIQNEIQHH